MTDRHHWLTLAPEEELVWSGQPRLRRLLPVVAIAGPWTLGALAVALAAGLGGIEPTTVLSLGGLLAAFVGIVVISGAHLYTVNTDYVLTTRNVYRKTGILSTSVTRVGIDAIQNTQLKKHALGALFDYGTVAISTAGSRGVDLRITDLDDPETLRTALRDRMGAVHRSEEPPTPLDAETAATIGAEFRALREAAERLEREVTGA